MDKPILTNSMKLFSEIGVVKSRSMFGGFGIFIDDTMFALVVNDRIHIRADKSTATKFQQLAYHPYVYQKRGFPVVTNYFALPDAYWQTPEKIIEYAKEALQVAKQAKIAQQKPTSIRLKDLPNLRLTTERMLKKAGIDSVSELQQQGSVEAFKAIQRTHKGNVSIELLWALEGAIEGKHWSVIPQDKRQQLAELI
ncbi:TfoX/Sxy family DNA transformation protein [Vibrio hippocampi]|uniref:DNA transformation protein TfoX1 n=1 Tax=Vibrio hippocampi TaxID=654686 RepID=A0ABM8ZG55_9VIBR|nr:TfoX/Sxy family DNA transformation protein [Vibrio hippocampi]CAH0525586.1 DNA transformation protein TfoX1 [Vibrio hippocampi]